MVVAEAYFLFLTIGTFPKLLFDCPSNIWLNCACIAVLLCALLHELASLQSSRPVHSCSATNMENTSQNHNGFTLTHQTLSSIRNLVGINSIVRMLKGLWAGEAVEMYHRGWYIQYPAYSVPVHICSRKTSFVCLFGIFSYVSDENLENSEKEFRSAN